LAIDEDDGVGAEDDIFRPDRSDGLRLLPCETRGVGCWMFSRPLALVDVRGLDIEHDPGVGEQFSTAR
jgi:hypothetical protein